jgi:hypothetical protein
MRRLIKKKHTEYIPFHGDLFLSLKEFPVNEITAVFLMSNEQGAMNNGEMIEPDFYHIIPDCGCGEDIPFTLVLSPALKRVRGLHAIKVIYSAGYSIGKIPADLASACVELAAWNMTRYKGRRIGITGSVRGSGRDGEHLEMSMPENVRQLLEPYKRRVI